jgi:hypothetical protein
LFAAADHERLLGWVNVGSPGEPSRKKSVAPEDGERAARVTVIGG